MGVTQSAAYSRQMMADPQEGKGKGPDFKVSAPFEFSLETLEINILRLILGLCRP